MRSNDKELGAWLQTVPKNPCPKAVARCGKRLEALATLHETLKKYVWKTGLDQSITQHNMDLLEALKQLEE